MMERLSDNNPVLGGHAVETSATSEAVVISLGKTLREARERLGLSIADVAAQIKLAPRQIEALEADDFKSLPEIAFVRGFVRSYAKILKLDAQTLLATLAPIKDVHGALTSASVEEPFPDAYFAQRQNLIWLGLALLLSLLIVVFAVRSYTAQDGRDLEPQDRGGAQEKTTLVEIPVSLPQEEQAVPDAKDSTRGMEPPVSDKEKMKSPETVAQPPVRAAKPVVVESAPKSQASASAAQAGTLRLEFDEESWVEIKDRDGNILASQAYQAGSDLRLDGNAPFSMLIGHAPSVRLFYRDKQVNLAPHTRPSTQVAHLTLE